MLRLLAIVAAMILPGFTAQAQTPPAQLRPGQVYEIRREVNSASTSTDEMGSTGTTHDVDTIVEHVVAVSDAGVELEFDLAGDIPADERARDWKFPARMLRPPHGPLQLLNGPQLQTRLQGWLRAAGLPSEACGSWYFTWNAFQIDCDP